MPGFFICIYSCYNILMAKSREDKVKTLRILEIDQMIREGRYPNATVLGKHFEVSRSTIMRDLDFLRDRYEAPLEYDQQKNGFYYSDPTFFIKSVMLTEKELFTVSVITPLMEQYKNTPLEASFHTIFKKITDMLPGEISVNPAFATNDIQFISDPLPKIEEETFNRIFQAVRTCCQVEFMYRSLKRQEYIPHRLNPYQVLCQKGNWYVIGLDTATDIIKIYSLARMKEIKCGKTHFRKPADFNIRNYIDPYFGIWNSSEKPVKIELLFSPQISTYILERKWHDTQELTANPDGSVYLSYSTNQLEETLHWVLGIGNAVQVLSPPELIERVKTEARKIMEKYQ